MLRPRDDIYLHLKFKFNIPEQLEPWINLLPCLKEWGFKIEDYNPELNELKDSTIQLHILNRNFTKAKHKKRSNNCIYVFTW